MQKKLGLGLCFLMVAASCVQKQKTAGVAALKPGQKAGIAGDFKLTDNEVSQFQQQQSQEVGPQALKDGLNEVTSLMKTFSYYPSPVAPENFSPSIFEERAEYCSLEYLKSIQFQATTGSNGDPSFTLKASPVFNNCVQEWKSKYQSEMKIKQLDFKTGYSFAAECYVDDFKPWDGKSFTDPSITQKFCGDSPETSLEFATFLETKTTGSDSKTRGYKHTKTLRGINKDRCIYSYEKGLRTYVDCVWHDVIQISASESPRVIQVALGGVKTALVDGIFNYGCGSVKVKVNNWEGEITFTDFDKNGKILLKNTEGTEYRADFIQTPISGFTCQGGQSQDQTQDQTQDQGQSQDQTQSQGQSQDQTQGQGQSQDQTQGQGQSASQGQMGKCTLPGVSYPAKPFYVAYAIYRGFFKDEKMPSYGAWCSKVQSMEGNDYAKKVSSILVTSGCLDPKDELNFSSSVLNMARTLCN